MLALAHTGVPGLQDELPAPPAWLTRESLADGQSELAERATELQQRLAAGLEQVAAGDPQALPPEQRELAAAVAEAEPLVRAGSDHAREAAVQLTEGELRRVPESQAQSLSNLSDARERFLDVRGLIEAAHGEQLRISGIVSPPEAQEGEGAPDEYAPALRFVQQRNLDRTARLESKLQQRAAQLEALALATEEGTLPADQQAPDPQQLEDERKHIDIASQVLALAVGAMEGVGKGLAETDEVDWEWVRSDNAVALAHLESLLPTFTKKHL